MVIKFELHIAVAGMDQLIEAVREQRFTEDDKAALNHALANLAAVVVRIDRLDKEQ